MATEVQTAMRLRVFCVQITLDVSEKSVTCTHTISEEGSSEMLQSSTRGKNVTSLKAAILVHINVLRRACLCN